MVNVQDNSCKRNQNTFYVQYLFSENHTLNETMSKNLVETEGSQKTPQYGAYSLGAGLARLHAFMRMHMSTGQPTHTHSFTHIPISNTRVALPRQQ